MRNKDRLDPLSTYNRMLQVEGTRTVERDVICYNLRGVMEICRLLRRFHFEILLNYFEQWSN